MVNSDTTLIWTMNVRFLRVKSPPIILSVSSGILTLFLYHLVYSVVLFILLRFVSTHCYV